MNNNKKPHFNTSQQLLLQNQVFNSIIHFIDFEFMMIEKTYIPIELGISTYALNTLHEINYFHELIEDEEFYKCNSKDEEKEMKFKMKEAIKIHGIQTDNKYIQPRKLVEQKLIKYLNEFQQSLIFFVVKDEEISGDYECMKQLLKEIPINYHFVTHHELFQVLLYSLSIEINLFKMKFLLNESYKALHSYHYSIKCNYHQAIDKKYHCGLEDARDTALMIFHTMKLYNITFNNQQQLPYVYLISIPTITTSSSFIFFSINTNSIGEPLEVYLSCFKVLPQFKILSKSPIYHFTTSNKKLSKSAQKEQNSMNRTNQTIEDAIQQFLSINSNAYIIVDKKGIDYVKKFSSNTILFNRINFFELLLYHYTITVKNPYSFYQYISANYSIQHKGCSFHTNKPKYCCLNTTNRYFNILRVFLKRKNGLLKNYRTNSPNSTFKSLMSVQNIIILILLLISLIVVIWLLF